MATSLPTFPLYLPMYLTYQPSIGGFSGCRQKVPVADAKKPAIRRLKILFIPLSILKRAALSKHV